MTQKDAIKTLYPVYSKNTAKPVTEEEFRNRLADPQKRKVLYQGFSNLGYADRIGTYEQFEKWLDASQQNPANVPIQELQRPGITDAQPISTNAQAQPQNNAHAQSYAQQTPPTAKGENAQDILRTGIAQGLKQRDERQDALLQTKEEGLQLQQMYDLFEKENEDAIFLAKTKRATAAVPGMVMPGSAYTEQEADVIKQRNTLQSALELNEKTQKILAAPSRFDDSNAFANFGKGTASKATDIDFWTFGITNIARNLNTRDVAMKLQKAQDEYGDDIDIDTILTEPEKALLGAFFNNLHASALRADDLSLGYQAGQGAMDSAKFMAEFILTGGISKAATKGATKALETWIIKNVASKAGRTLAKGGLAVAKGLVGTAARTPVMLSTYSNITDQAVLYDENGRLQNGFEAVGLGFLDSFIENLSETMGEHIIAGMKLPFTGLISKIPETGFTKFFQNLSKTGAYKLMKQGGWNGFAGEYFEEWYGNSLRALTGNKEALQDFATVEQQLITLASFAPITILGGAVSTAQYASAEKNFQNATLALKDILKDNGYKTSQAEYIMDLIMDTTPSQMAKKVAPIINQMALETEGDAGNLLTGISEFIRTKSIMQGYDGIYEAEHQEKRNELDQEIQNEIGEYTNKKGEVEMAVDKDGNANYVLSDVADELEPLIVVKGLDGQTKMVSKSEYEANYTPSVLTSKDEYLSEMIMTKQTQELAEETKIEEDANFLNSIELGVPQYFNINGVMTEGTPQAITPDGSITVHFGNHVEMLTADQYKALNQPTAVTAAQTEELAQAEQEQAAQEQEAQEQAEQEQEERAQEQVQPVQEEQQSLAPEEAAQGQVEPEVPTKELPKTEDGETDFDALLDADPETYAQELSKAIGEEKAANTMSALAKQTDAQIEKLQKRLEKETSTNKIVSLSKEINQLQQRRDALTGLIIKGSKPQTPQTLEVTDGQTAQPVQAGAANDQGAVLPGDPKDNEPGGPVISADVGEQTEVAPATNEGSGTEVDTQPIYSEQKEDTGTVSAFKAAQEQKGKNEVQDKQDGKTIIPQKISKPKMPKTKEEYCRTLAGVVSNDPIKPAMTGVLFDADNKMIVATDAFKLIAIPSNLPKTTEIIGASKREFGQLLKGQYPDYKGVIPLSSSERFEGRFNIELLLGQALTMLKEANERIKQLDRPTDREKAHERILKFGIHNVNAKQLSDLLRALYDTGTKHVVVEHSGKERPLVFRDETDMNKVGLVMPVYIPEEGEDGFEKRFRNIPVLVNRNTIAINKEPGNKKEKKESEKEDSAMKPDNSPVAEEEEKAKEEERRRQDEVAQAKQDQNRKDAITKEQYESFDTRGYTYAVVKDGKVVTRGSNPILAKEPMPIKSLLDIADNLNGDLYIAPTSGQPIDTSSTDDLIMGLTWQQILDKQRGENINLAIELNMPKNAVLFPKYEQLYQSDLVENDNARQGEQNSHEAIEGAEESTEERLQREADEATAEFLEAFNDLQDNSPGIIDNTAEKQAKMLIAGTKMVAAYTKLGVYKFADLVNRLAKKGIQITEDLLSALKKAYAAFAAENDIDELDEMKAIRAFKLSDINTENDQKSESEEVKPEESSGVVSVFAAAEKAKERPRQEIRKTFSDYKLCNIYIPETQKAAVREMWRNKSEEIESITQDVEKSLEAIPSIPQDKGYQSIVYAHYFIGQTDIYILDTDRDEGLMYTYTILNGDYEMSEFGYQSIKEVTNIRGMELDFYWDPAPLNEVLYQEAPNYFDNPKKETENNGQETRSTETIESETEAIEAASESIRSESENVGSDQQRAGDVKEQADEQVEKIETLLNQVDEKLAELKLSGKNYSTDGIEADYPINILAKGAIKKDATAYVKAVADMTGLEHDTDRKGKREIVNVNIAPAGGDVTFVLWSKKNPDYGVYVSIPYSPDYRDWYDDYHVKGSILWRVTTKQDKWGGMSNQYVDSDVTAQEMAETLLKGLNQELKSRGLEQEINEVKVTPEKVKNTKINPVKVRKTDENQLPLFQEEDSITNKDNNNEYKPKRGSETESAGVGKTAQQNTGEPNRGRVDRSDTDNNGPDLVRSTRTSDASSEQTSGTERRNANNNRNERGVDYFPKAAKARFNANIEAIKLMRELNNSGVTVPTREQMGVLRKFSGWGGLGSYFNDNT